MDINDVNPWDVFGLEDPEAQTQTQPEGGKEQEPDTATEDAVPAGEGAKEQEPAEPDTEDDTDGGQEPETEPDAGEQPENAEEKKPLTKQERAENARRRRQKEVDDAVKAAVEAERAATNARLEQFFGQAKMKNQYNQNAEIKSLEDAEAWAREDRQNRLQQNLKAGKLTQEDLQAAVEQTPVIKAIKDQQQQAQKQEDAANRAMFQRTMDTELAEIRKLNPAIQSLNDILAMETGRKFAQYVKSGNLGFLDAYKLANMDSIMAQQRTVAASSARDTAGGKDHLKPTKTRGKGLAEVPADVMENFRALMPDMTDEEIRREYNLGLK